MVLNFLNVKRRVLKRALVLAIALFVSINTMTNIGKIFQNRRLCANVMVRHTMSNAEDRELIEDCATYWPQGTGPLESWEYRFPPKEHVDDPNRIWPTNDVGYVVPFMSCPEADGVPAVDSQHDAENAFVDSAAIMKHAIACAGTTQPLAYTESQPASADQPSLSSPSSSENTYISGPGTMYAILHSSAVACTGPNGLEYDRATVLQNLGYWVKIWDSPVAEKDLASQTYILDNIQNDVGLKDLIKLQALKLENHDFVVLLDPNYVLKEPLDDAFTELNDSDEIASYVIDPITGGVSTSMLIMKPSLDTFNTLVDMYTTVPYTETTGWGDSNIGLFPGGMGTSGLLTYYFNESQVSATELDRCHFDNNADDVCNKTPYDTIVGYSVADDICGQPWTCTYGDKQDEWSDDTKILCNLFLVHWIEQRQEFEEEYFNQPPSAGGGQFHVEIYHGLCNSSGPDGYIPVLKYRIPKQENCIAGADIYHGCDTTHTDPTTTELGGAQLEVSISSPQQCDIFIAGPNNAGARIPFSGTTSIVATGAADTSMVFVIDRSGSTCDHVSLGCASDENFDLQFDDVLDCQIAAILDLVSKVRAEGTVSHIGLVSFSHELSAIETASVELPLTDIGIVDQHVSHAIEHAIREVDCGGGTNYAAAVEMACGVIEESTTKHNVVVFISDGLPTRGGSPTAYCRNNAVFHTVALGPYANCESGFTTSLTSISQATGGTCQNVPHIADIRLFLPKISDAKIISVQGSAVASEASVNFGCTDVPDFRTAIIGFTCDIIGKYGYCGTYFVGISFQNMGYTGDSACCTCGGGVYLDIGDFANVPSNVITEPDTSAMSVYDDTAILHPGEHTVCTSVMASDAGVPGMNKQCKNILVCANPADY